MMREYIAKCFIGRVARYRAFRHKKRLLRIEGVQQLLNGQWLCWFLENNRIGFLRVLTHFMEVQVTVCIGSRCVNLIRVL